MPKKTQKKPHWGPEQRRLAKERMQKYWADRKAGKRPNKTAAGLTVTDPRAYTLTVTDPAGEEILHWSLTATQAIGLLKQFR